MAGPFERALSMMRKRDPQAQEAGFSMLKQATPEFADELIATFEDESLRSWAAEGLSALDSKAARTALWQHGRV